MLRSLALAGVCVLLAGFALSSPMPPLSLSARLAAPGGTSPMVPSARIDALLARLPHRQGMVAGSGGVALHWLAFDPGDMDTPLHALAVPDADPATLKSPAIAARELLDAHLAVREALA